MKRRSRRDLSIFDRAAAAALIILSVTATIPRTARASAELDRTYALETVAALRAWDNVDELFSDYVSAAYRDFFGKQSRFVFQELGRADALLEKAKLPYTKVIEDNDILGQVARSTRSQSLIRTRITKEGDQYRFKLEWLHSPRMDVMSTDTFVLAEKADLEPGQPHGEDDSASVARKVGLSEIKTELQKSLERLIRKVPFLGNVTGRDGEAVTVNIGAASGLRKGDTLVLGTLDEVKRHPLLHAVVDWRFSETGRAEVETVDERIAFCQLRSEPPGRQVARGQKVLQIIQPEKPALPAQEVARQEAEAARAELPTLGFVSAGPTLGGFARQYSAAAGTGKSGSGFALGARVDGQLWLDRSWFAEVGLGYQFWNYSQQDLTAAGTSGTPGTGVSASLSTMRIDLGYNYLINRDFFGPKGWVKLGFKSGSYSFPVATVASGEVIGPEAVRSIFVGVGGDLPLRGQFGALLNFEFGVIPFAAETGFLSGAVSSARDVEFNLGGYYRVTPRLSVRAIVDIISHGMDFSGGTTLSNKVVDFAPSVVYLF